MGCNGNQNVLTILHGIIEHLGFMLLNLVESANGVMLDPQLVPVCCASPRWHAVWAQLAPPGNGG